MSKMQCPVCGSQDTKRTFEEVDDLEAVRDYECRDCQSTWKLFGEPIIEVIRVIWNKEASDIQYGPTVDLEAMQIERIMNASKSRTIPMFES